MTDLLLSARDQAAVRAVIAADPVPGAVLPAECALQHLARLVDCDALGIALLDVTGSPVEESALPREGAVLTLGVHNGPGHVVTLWLVRRTRDFSERDRALLALVRPALERLLREPPAAALPQSITVQERRVLGLVATGLSNAEIAERLVVAPCTVRKHLENAYRKLGVTNRLAAVNAMEPDRLPSTGSLAGWPQPPRAAETTSLASACTRARWSGPRKDSA